MGGHVLHKGMSHGKMPYERTSIFRRTCLMGGHVIEFVSFLAVIVQQQQQQG